MAVDKSYVVTLPLTPLFISPKIDSGPNSNPGIYKSFPHALTSAKSTMTGPQMRGMYEKKRERVQQYVEQIFRTRA